MDPVDAEKKMRKDRISINFILLGNGMVQCPMSKTQSIGGVLSIEHSI